MISRSTPLDDFLAETGQTSGGGEALRQIGAGVGIGGVALAIGALVFLAVITVDRRSDLRAIQTLVVLGGVLAVLGGAIELGGVANLLDTGWDDALTSELGHASFLRLVGGFLLVLGLVERVRAPIQDEDEVSSEHRWVPDSSAAVALVGAAMAAISFGLDGHSVTEGPRLVHVVVNFVHVVAASAWFGGLVALSVVSWRRRRAGMKPRIVHAFSAIATVSLVAVSVAGVVLAVFVLDSIGDLTGSDWGRLLLVKLALVAIPAAFGGYNHFVIIPALASSPTDEAVARRARINVTVEAISLVAVVVVTSLLIASSSN